MSERLTSRPKFLFAAFLLVIDQVVAQLDNVSNTAQNKQRAVMETTTVPTLHLSHRCIHGTFNITSEKCECFPGWATAGPTDTIDFLEGVCEQYRCVSDTECQRLLNIPGATCPVPNWNCYCGWEWAFQYNWHGYETDDKGGAECMGVMYTLSVGASEFVLKMMRVAWLVVLVLALLLLPCGRRRSYCDHDRASMWNGLKACWAAVTGSELSPPCGGACLSAPAPYCPWSRLTWSRLEDDLAWSIYVLELGVWGYVFLVTVLLVVLFIWSVVLWAIVAVIGMVAAAAALLTVCGECLGGGGNDCAGCDCNPCDCCFPGGFDGGAHHGFGAGDCCGMPTGAPEQVPMLPAGGPAQVSDVNVFYGQPAFDCYWCNYGSYSSYPYSYTDQGCTSCCPCDRRCCFCCRPLAWLCYVFPTMPENALGGFCGLHFFGTHAAVRPSLGGEGDDTFIISVLRMRWIRDLHGDENWRDQVRNFLDRPAPLLPEPPPAPSRAQRFEAAGQADEEQQTSFNIGNVEVRYQQQPFTEADGCPASSFQDYKDGTCWICQTEKETWDMWRSCRHLFCASCSAKMLQRRMPCPLCRVPSLAVSRAPKFQRPPDGEPL